MLRAGATDDIADVLHRSDTTRPVDVLIVARLNDVHALSVARRIEDRGGRTLILDAADYPSIWQLTTRYERGCIARNVTSRGREVDLSQLRGIWYRRFYGAGHAPAIADEAVRGFVADECRDYLQGFLASLSNVINIPANEWQANRKAYQLACALEVGLEIPETCITTEPEVIRPFVDSLDGGAIYKCLTSTPFQFTETRRIGSEEWVHIQHARVAPTIFQKRIEADHHLRITVVDDAMFATKLTTSHPAGDNDWRLDQTRTLEPTETAPKLRAGIHALMRKLGLRYGALDFIVDKNGTTFFLENNPGGQFLFVEIHAELPISAALADSLLGCRDLAKFGS